MEQDQIISSLFNMLQKSNNEKINMQLTIDKLTAEVNALKKEKEEQKDDWKVEIEKSEK
jgi:HAMP domain-containing protein|tara:strand:- start:691 stop:867 length:177 start_codon:yes stop_codon:yes gene_type:complete